MLSAVPSFPDLPPVAGAVRAVTTGRAGGVAEGAGDAFALALDTAGETAGVDATPDPASAAVDVKFFLMNYTTGACSAVLTFAQDIRSAVFTDVDLAVAAGDVLGVVVTQEDGTNEPSGVILELSITADAG